MGVRVREREVELANDSRGESRASTTTTTRARAGAGRGARVRDDVSRGGFGVARSRRRAARPWGAWTTSTKRNASV